MSEWFIELLDWFSVNWAKLLAIFSSAITIFKGLGIISSVIKSKREKARDILTNKTLSELKDLYAGTKNELIEIVSQAKTEFSSSVIEQLNLLLLEYENKKREIANKIINETNDIKAEIPEIIVNVENIIENKPLNAPNSPETEIAEVVEIEEEKAENEENEPKIESYGELL